MKELNAIGKSVRKLDVLDKVTGEGTFTADLHIPGMLYAKVLRCPYPHAKIKKIDISRAERLPGVKAVSCHHNTTKVKFNCSALMTFTVPPHQPVLDEYLFGEVLRYVGDEVAAVAAESEDIAAEALKLIDVEYEILPAVFDPLEAMEPEAPVLHEENPAGKNIVGGKVQIPIGDIAQGFEESEVIVEKTYKVPVQKHAQIEPHAAVAQVSAGGRVTVWSPTQNPHPTRHIIAHLFELPLSKVRVLNPPYVGGAFGGRIGFSGKAEGIAVDLAYKTDRPIKIVYERDEDFVGSVTRHSGYVTIKIGAKKDGTFHALQVETVLNKGAYANYIDPVGVLGGMALGVYRAPYQYFDGWSVYTNTSPAGAMRGFGNPQGAFALECTVDMMAEKLGMDPKELRLKNIIKPGDPWCLPYPCQSTGLADCMNSGAERIGWKNRGKLNTGEGSVRRGIGMAVGTHVSNSWPFCGDYSNVYVAVQQDGSLYVASGVPDFGTGIKTSLAQVAADALGVDFNQVYVTVGDTECTPYDTGSHASRSLYCVGGAILEAVEKIKSKIFEYAAEVLETNAEALNLKNGIISTGDGSKHLSLKEAAYSAHLQGLQFVEVGRSAKVNAPPWQAHFAEVEVDTETGEVKVIKLVAAHDVGRAIHPGIVEGQIEGSIIQGIGYALSEEICYNEKGKQIQTDFANYMMLTAEDIPEIETIIIETLDPTGPFGAKGVGEPAMVPVAPAILNAVHDAIGIRFNEIPLKAEMVYAALNNSK